MPALEHAGHAHPSPQEPDDMIPSRIRTALVALTAVVGLTAVAAPMASAGPMSRVDGLRNAAARELVRTDELPNLVAFDITGIRAEGWSIDPEGFATSRVRVWGSIPIEPNSLEASQAFLASGHWVEIELGKITAPGVGKLYFGPVNAQMRYDGGRVTFDSSFAVANSVLDWNKIGTDSLYACATLFNPQGYRIKTDATAPIAGEWGHLADIPDLALTPIVGPA
jgi:hypothetical protein